jgi:hypothetical protein
MGFAVVAALLVLAAAVIWIVGPVPLFGLHGGDLYQSVSSEVGAGDTLGSSGGFTCARTRSRIWRCDVPDRASSGGATYLVRVKGDGCWTARRLRDSVEGGSMPREASACVGLDDLLRPGGGGDESTPEED